jgi:hypothetical protein
MSPGFARIGAFCRALPAMGSTEVAGLGRALDHGSDAPHRAWPSTTIRATLMRAHPVLQGCARAVSPRIGSVGGNQAGHVRHHEQLTRYGAEHGLRVHAPIRASDHEGLRPLPLPGERLMAGAFGWPDLPRGSGDRSGAIDPWLCSLKRSGGRASRSVIHFRRAPQGLCRRGRQLTPTLGVAARAAAPFAR